MVGISNQSVPVAWPLTKDILRIWQGDDHQLLESRWETVRNSETVPFRHVLLKRHAPCKTSQAGTSGTVWKFAVWSLKRQRQLVFVLRYFFWIWIWFTFVPFGSFRNTSQIVCGPVAHAYPPSICSRAEYRHRTSNHSGHSAARPLGKANGPRLFSTFFNWDHQISSLSDNSNKINKFHEEKSCLGQPAWATWITHFCYQSVGFPLVLSPSPFFSIRCLWSHSRSCHCQSTQLKLPALQQRTHRRSNSCLLTCPENEQMMRRQSETSWKDDAKLPMHCDRMCRCFSFLNQNAKLYNEFRTGVKLPVKQCSR